MCTADGPQLLSSAPPTTAPLLRLDQTLLFDILEHVPEEDLPSVRLTCRMLCSAGAQLVSELKLDAHDYDFKAPLPSKLQGFDHLEDLTIDYAHSYDDGEISEEEMNRTVRALLGDQRRQQLGLVHLDCCGPESAAESL